jgi:hypothetical protein
LAVVTIDNDWQLGQDAGALAAGWTSAARAVVR